MITYKFKGKPEELEPFGWKKGHLRFGDNVWYKECFFKSLTPGKVYYIVLQGNEIKGYSVIRATKEQFSVIQQDVEDLLNANLVEMRKTYEAVRRRRSKRNQTKTV